MTRDLTVQKGWGSYDGTGALYLIFNDFCFSRNIFNKMKYNMNFALKIALNSNSMDIIEKIILMSKGRSPHIFTCVAEGESRSRSAVTPSVCLSVRPSQNLVIATPLKLLIQLS